MSMQIELPVASGDLVRLRFSGEGLWVLVGNDVGFTTVEASLLIKWSEIAVLAGAVTAGFTAVQYRGAIAGSWLIAEWAPQHLWTAAAAIAGAALAVGILLAYWKRNQQLLYGVFEIVFGTLTTLQVALTLWPNGEISKFVAIGSALYVISRGAGNVADSFKKEALRERLRLKVADTDILKEMVGSA